MQDLILTRVWIGKDELEGSANLYTASLGINPKEIHFYEEYVYDTLAEYGKPLTTIYTYTGEIVIVDKPFKQFADIMEKYRKESGSFFNIN